MSTATVSQNGPGADIAATGRRPQSRGGGASDIRATVGQGQGGEGAGAALLARRVGAGAGPARSGRRCSRSRRRRACRSWCRSATGGCWCRRSRSTAAPPRLMAADLAGDAADGAARAAVRRRAPVELRRVRGSRPAAGLRRQRLRRDAARARSSGTSSGSSRASRSPGATAGSTPSSATSVNLAVRTVLPRGDARRSPRCATLDLWYARLDVEDLAEQLAPAGERQAAQAVRPQRRQGRARRTACGPSTS